MGVRRTSQRFLVHLQSCVTVTTTWFQNVSSPPPRPPNLHPPSDPFLSAQPLSRAPGIRSPSLQICRFWIIPASQVIGSVISSIWL